MGNCSICLEEIDKDALTTPCAHTFHKNCIERWLETSDMCPLCRTESPREIKNSKYTKQAPNFSEVVGFCTK